MTPTILIPVKDQARAKSRMNSFLTQEERVGLAWAMFGDLSRALRPLRAPVVLVTDSDRAARQAAESGWRVLMETSIISESASVDAASAQLASEGVSAVLRLPADLPLVQSQDIESLLYATPGVPGAILVPSRDRMGTNAILRTPPDLFPSRFGHNSLVLHTQEAMRTRAHLEIRENPRIALDLDDAPDIAFFLKIASDTESYRFLASLRLPERGV